MELLRGLWVTLIIPFLKNFDVTLFGVRRQLCRAVRIMGGYV